MYYSLFRARLLSFIKYSAFAFLGIILVQLIAYIFIKKTHLDSYTSAIVIVYFFVAISYFFFTLAFGLMTTNKIFDFASCLLEFGALIFLVYTFWQIYVMVVVNI